MEIARWHYSCCACLPGCKNARDTLLLLLYFQQLLTFYCNLFSFYPLLLKNNNSTVLIINQQLWHPKDLLAEDLFLPAKGAQARHTQMSCRAHPAFQSYIFLSVAFPFQGRGTTVSHQWDPIPAWMWCLFWWPPPPLLSVRGTKDSHKP